MLSFFVLALLLPLSSPCTALQPLYPIWDWRRFGIGAEAFAVLLIGKDGTEKQRETVPVEPGVLVRTIDAMLMRQQEQHQREQRT